MTREEHIENLKKLKSFHNGSYGASIQVAIKALEQEPVIDEIRAEIQENINYNKKMNYQGIVAGLLLTLTIIDKYKAERSEE